MNAEEILDRFFLSYMPGKDSVGKLRDIRLERMNEILEVLGNPERNLTLVHVAGSKGKGSMSSILAKLLEGKGCKTGLFLSPHVFSLFERFTLSSSFFSDEEYLYVLNRLEKDLDKLSFRPSTFELYTAYAYLLFSMTGCTHAVIETGLGGRLDATNTIDPWFSVIMPIELEHTEILGDTLEKIAREKAGIIKRGKPCFVFDSKKEVLDVFLSKGKELSSGITTYQSLVKSVVRKPGKWNDKLEIELESGRKCTLGTKLKGEVMGENIAFALAIAEKEGFLDDNGLDLLSSLTMPGRFEIVSVRGKTVVLDVAHTINSTIAFTKTFSETFGYGKEKRVLLYSSLENKKHEEMLAILSKTFDSVIITRAGSFKKSNPDELGKEAEKYFKSVMIIPSEDEAFEKALSIGDIVAVAGSFYLIGSIGELRHAQLERSPQNT